MIEQKAQALGWFFTGSCGCTPKKHTYQHNAYPGYKLKITPSRGAWYLEDYNGRRVAQGQEASLESQLTNFNYQ